MEILKFLRGIAKPAISIWNLTQSKNQNILYTETQTTYGYAMSKFLPTSGFKWIDPKEFDLDKYTSNNSKGYFLKSNLEYLKELCELHNDYPDAPYKIEIKKEMLSKYQLIIADLYNIPIGNIKKLVHNFFDKEKYVLHYDNLQLYLRLGLMFSLQRVLKLNQSQ